MRLRYLVTLLLIALTATAAVRAYKPQLRTIKVKVVADERYARQTNWERHAKAELDDVADALGEILNIRLDIVAYDQWYGERESFDQRTAHMLEEVARDSADIVVGFTLIPAAIRGIGSVTEGLTIPYRGMMVKTYQGNRSYNYFLPLIIVHEMVHVLGGVHVGGNSIMSPQFGKQIVLELDDLNRAIVDITRQVDFQVGVASLSDPLKLELTRLYARALDNGNQELMVFLTLADLYSRLDRYQEAIATYLLMLEVYPEYNRGRILLGECYLLMGRADKTIEIFEDALKYKQDRDLLHGKLAVLYYNAGDFDQSYYHAKKADAFGADIDPDLIYELRKKRGKQ